MTARRECKFTDIRLNILRRGGRQRGEANLISGERRVACFSDGRQVAPQGPRCTCPAKPPPSDHGLEQTSPSVLSDQAAVHWRQYDRASQGVEADRIPARSDWPDPVGREVPRCPPARRQCHETASDCIRGLRRPDPDEPDSGRARLRMTYADGLAGRRLRLGRTPLESRCFPCPLTGEASEATPEHCVRNVKRISFAAHALT